MQAMPPNVRARGLSRPQHSRRASPALQALTELDPALATLSLWCRHRDSDAVDLVATAGSEIRYGAGYAAQPRHLQIGLSGHHILHVALQHSARMAAMDARLGAEFDAEMWQISCDAIVNEAILAAGHALPRPCVTLSGLMEGAGAALLAAWDAERLYFRLTSASGAGRGEVKAKARAQGFHPDLAPGEDSPAKGGDLDRGDWRGHMARALAASRAAGVGLGAAGFRLADLPRATIAWEHVLRHWLNLATLHRPGPAPLQPARRWLAMAGQAHLEHRALPPWQANLAAPQPRPTLMIALDTSGSIPASILARFMAEAAGVARRLRAACTLVPFDTELRAEVTLDPAQWRQTLAQLDLPEGGGTDFRPVFDLASVRTPSGLILLTDLDGPMPPKPPRFPVLWASADAAPPAPPFGRLLSLAR